MRIEHAHVSVGQVLREQARRLPDVIAVRCGEESRTFAELDERADALASGFAGLGVEHGDRVAILAPNRIEVLELFFALARLGAIQVPLNAFLKGEFLRHQLVDAQPKVLVADASGLRAAQPLLNDLPHIGQLVALDPSPGAQGSMPVTGYQSLLTTVVVDHDPLSVAPSDVMSILYTSGTTGLPKGCMMSHAYYLHTGRAMARAWDVTEQDVLLTALPLFHSAGRLMVVATALVCGVTVVVEEEFSVRRWFPRLRETGATFACMVGAMGMALLQSESTADERDHSLRAMSCTPMEPQAQVEFEARFGVKVWAEAFGQTECLPVSCNSLDEVGDRANGRPVDWLDVVILDAGDLAVEEGQVGEICVRPRYPGVMFSGYWNRPDATVQATTTLWYHTGDYGRINGGGNLEFVGRKKESVRRRGENVSMFELEAAIARCPAVQEAAIVAVPSGASEDDIFAFVVLTKDAEVAAEDLFQFFSGNLPYFAVPRYVQVVPSLPRNALGRVMRYGLERVPEQTWDFEALGLSVARGQRRD